MPVTLTEKAACATVAGLVFSAVMLPGAPAQQAQQETQPPAPVVRVAPPQTRLPQVSPRTASPSPRTATPDQTLPEIAQPTRRPRPVIPSPSQSSSPREAGSAPTAPRPALTGVPAKAAGSPATGYRATSNPGTKPAATVVSPTTKPTVIEHKPSASAFSATGLNRNIILLDPAHGGTDGGARIGDTTLEKNVTLALAFRLRSLLVARGFTVVMTRDSDAATEPNAPSTPLTLDDRAGIANHARAAACLLLHATGRGMGVHLYHSELEPTPAEAALLPWLTAQSAWIPASRAFEGQMNAALGRSKIQLVSSTASVRPVDSLTCPALVVELAPGTDTPNSINDAAYQSRIAAAIAGALVVWKDAVQPPFRVPAPAYVPHPKKQPEPVGDSPLEVQP